MKRWTILVGIVLLVAVVVGGAGYLGYRASRPNASAAVQAPPTIAVTRGDVVQSVDAPGQLVGMRDRTLSLSTSGRLSKLNVRAGDHVHVGDVLAQLDDSAFRYALQTAQANLASAQAKLAKLKEPPSVTTVAAAQAQVASAQSAYDAAVAKNVHAGDQIIVAKAALDKATVALQQAQSVYDAVSWRSDIGMLPQSTALQQATIDYRSALANYNLTATGINDSAVKAAAQTLAQAQSSLLQLTAPPDPHDLATNQADVDKAQVLVHQAQDNLDQSKLVAPFDGVVQAVRANAGDTLTAGAPLIQLSDSKALEARSTVTEEDYPLIKVGQVVQLYFDSQPELGVTGKVMEIVPLREASSSSPIYPIFVALDNVPDGLAPGMTVDASILIAKRASVLRLPRALVHARSDGTAQIQIWSNGKTETRAVKTGLRGDQYVEILSGLSEGEQVVSR
ncbi:MAG: efflux RND transporter periplasmic adaptor subunit [Chloroflexi bacterium]|nr:efflux RND transporter periplasmic adaptor subunit [Chloroflexota bacterium]